VYTEIRRDGVFAPDAGKKLTAPRIRKLSGSRRRTVAHISSQHYFFNSNKVHNHSSFAQLSVTSVAVAHVAGTIDRVVWDEASKGPMKLKDIISTMHATASSADFKAALGRRDTRDGARAGGRGGGGGALSNRAAIARGSARSAACSVSSLWQRPRLFWTAVVDFVRCDRGQDAGERSVLMCIIMTMPLR
jgi:hypothetical protein